MTDKDTILESLYNDFEKVKESLRFVARKVIEEDISEFPIFVASHEWVEIGKPIFNREEIELNWFFFVSFVEEFEKRKLILRAKLKDFKETYNDAEVKACIFLITETEAQFIFVPY